MLDLLNEIINVNSSLYKTPQSRLKHQVKIDKIVNNWTKKNTIRFLGKVLSSNSVPWGEVKTFSQFLIIVLSHKGVTR